MLEAWNAEHGNRFRGAAIFTFGGPGNQWDHFELDEQQRRELANALT